MYSFHTFQKYLAQIFTKTCFMAAILNKMQDGGHIGVGANVNIVFLISYVISFPKMYSFHTLQKIPTKLHSELDYPYLLHAPVVTLSLAVLLIFIEPEPAEDFRVFTQTCRIVNTRRFRGISSRN